LKAVFGEHAPQAGHQLTKSMTGHLLGAAGGFEAAGDGAGHPRPGAAADHQPGQPGPECDLDTVPNAARKASVRCALSNSFGFGGTNGALVFKRFEG